MPALLALFPDSIENHIERIIKSLDYEDFNMVQEGLQFVLRLRDLLNEYKNTLRQKGIELEDIEFLCNPYMEIQNSINILYNYFTGTIERRDTSINHETARACGVSMETQLMLLKELSLKIDRSIK